MNRSSSIRKPSILRSSKLQVANSFDAMDDTELYSAKEVRTSTRAKISQNVGRVTQPVRQGASNIATKGRQGVDAVKRRGRQGVDAVRSKGQRGVENLRARSKSVPRVRRSTFQVSKVMRDKPLPTSVFGRKKEKKEKCQEDWRNIKSSSGEKKETRKKSDGSHNKKDESEFVRTRSSGSQKEKREMDEDENIRHYEDDEVNFSRTRSSGSRKSDRDYHVEIDDGY